MKFLAPTPDHNLLAMGEFNDRTKGRHMYSDNAAVAAVPAGAAGAALFAPTQAAIGLALLAALFAIVAVLMIIRSQRLGATSSN